MFLQQKVINVKI